ncbi:tetratricopeptide repeat protein [Massilia sp. RP-1-19]|uniref:Tetratricopeptide repeat protein n=1 Tax=Massilia polaris TaxID=2728846 RepID=A0A848HQG1_9BURK|nr:tetratricopeptide repeat protein [Massilia polaris]NML60838.1 tetratricopeptide repeat protein [Massilia polaris]
MSLINKMLQDLDARGSAPGAAAPGAAAQSKLKSVSHGRNPPVAAIGVAAAVALMLAAGAGYWWLKRPAAGAVASAPVKMVQQMPPEVVDDEAPPMPIIQVEPARATEPDQEPAPRPAVPRHETPKRAVPVVAASTQLAEPGRPQPPTETGRQMTPRQRAESEYNRALASLQDGRVGEAIAGFEQAISIEPRHEAARQTLVGLLVEAGRKGPAMRVLQNGLTLDPRQPAMAMLLARLQIEGGTSGIDTLMRTLPYAQGNGEYYAFLAGALARDDRHREAAEQYQAALRSAPGNGIWWMGLGISLQAEKRTAEAVAAFERASQSTNLTPQLRTFVDRKLELLSR